MDSDLLIVGASVRAATFSAIRAGLRPWAIDLFADRDLSAVCPAQAVPPSRYPAALVDMAREAPLGPWLYTGALENWPELVEQIARDRPLWGNDAACLRRVRDPFALADAIHAADLPCPAVILPNTRVPSGRWLIKSVASGGGNGIQFAKDGATSSRSSYLQEFVEGESRAGIFVADGNACRLLGVTRQLVGEKWLHARRFRYAGSVGPLSLTSSEWTAWEQLGAVVSRFADLRGVFGIDAIMRDGVPWPVEVNPRYTASVEVIELATGLKALVQHRGSFDGNDSSSAPPIIDRGLNKVVGKAVWYAPRDLIFPNDGPWEAVLRRPPAIDEPPEFADIPLAGQRIVAVHPVLTMFATAADLVDCELRLRMIARDLDALLLR